MSLPHFRQTLHSWEFLSPPTDPGAAGRPTVRGGQSGRGPRGGAVTPGCTPDPRPRRRSSARAPRPRWPRYCFTFPGVYFSLSIKKRDGGRRDPGLCFPLPGRARPAPNRPGEGLGPDPRAQPAPGPSPPLLAPPSGSAPLAAAPPRASRAPRESDLTTAGSLRASVRGSVRPPGRTPLGTHRLLPVLPLRHQQRRSAPPESPPPPVPAAAPGLAERRARAAACERGAAPGPTPPSRSRRRAAGLRAWPEPGGVLAGHSGAAPAGGQGHPRTRTQLACGPAAPKVNQGFTCRLPPGPPARCTGPSQSPARDPRVL